jgi:hypothetical protein
MGLTKGMIVKGELEKKGFHFSLPCDNNFGKVDTRMLDGERVASFDVSSYTIETQEEIDVVIELLQNLKPCLE